MDESYKRKWDYHGQSWTMWLCRKKVLHRQIFIVGYLQFVKRKHLHIALCSTGYGGSTVARKLNRQLSVSGIATPLKNGSVKPSRSSQGADGDL
jgi:hypothetical protein